MRVWFDTEFIEDGKTIDPISIGLVREDGAEYYAEFIECDTGRASLWVSQNVMPHLDGTAKVLRPRWKIAKDVVEFCGSCPEIWAYYADYDWVVMCQLFGRMIDLPSGWPMFCLDVQQMRYLDHEKAHLDMPPLKGNMHNALDDAQWCKEVWEWLHTPKPQ